jgi:hypothetical protein
LIALGGLAIALGPALLAWVGLASPAIGPLAVQSVLAWLGGLAGMTLAFVSWNSKRQLRKAIGLQRQGFHSNVTSNNQTA